MTRVGLYMLAGCALTACAPKPMSPQAARDLCLVDIADDGVSGTVGIGVGSSGTRAGAAITVTDKALRKRNLEAELADCIARRVEGRGPKPTFGITIGATT
ncbi:hypothetical protein [Nereida sp. MMG025]|uniref:hypothetical protein n=1 Tax=Nereida sp. MMG025 TaxID=2909981 RepID=UPI001F48E584|nr:hypothetical protein [Nereida sp. MMG025]MCF6445507.1 hypothetical protein [Nereida sp. MMG025]